ncbi:hypothetical protein M9H77_21841 [Catharanthus roseus]|uniref:Uncharacterized protein n=1 Tax=Catharanthus roseus TaxID=4058 RepID=A0ACC0ANI3_CATRO|nr:hypothetical protein M9H77_21841 [Catharanthus roseus]
MNWDNQEAKGLIQGPITRVRTRKIMKYDVGLAKGMVAFIEETMKNGLKSKNEGIEDDGKPSKLLMTNSISKKYQFRSGKVQEECNGSIEVLLKEKGPWEISKKGWKNKDSILNLVKERKSAHEEPHKRSSLLLLVSSKGRAAGNKLKERRSYDLLQNLNLDETLAMI